MYNDSFKSPFEWDDSRVLPARGSVNSVNTPNELGDVPLHTAIMQDDINMLRHLLDQPDIDVNYKRYEGETPLLMSLRRFRSDEFITLLLEAGCNPNSCSTSEYKQTPLHIAMLRPTLDIAHQLIKRGADLNVQHEDHRTAMHLAVNKNNAEGVCMLLYYGADFTLNCRDRMAAFMFALRLNRESIVQVLFPFYDDITDEDIDGYAALHLAARAQNPIALVLVRAGVNVNRPTVYGESAILFSLCHKSAELFKLIWARIDHQVLLEMHPRFFVTYLCHNAFSVDDFVECTYLILASPEAYNLLRPWMDIEAFQELVLKFSCLCVEAADRLAIINIFLSLGFKPSVYDINFVYQLYGFNDELEALLYSFDCDYELADLDSPVLKFILGKGNCSFAEIWEVGGFIDSRIDCYFSTAFYYTRFPRKRNDEDSSKGAELFECLSLRELSRNEANRFILQNCKFKKAYQFHDFVKRLKLPPYVQDIVRFKMPLSLHENAFAVEQIYKIEGASLNWLNYELQ